MHNLKPITALGGTEPRVDIVKNMTLTENSALALASVAARRGHENTCSKHLEELLGSPPPGPGKAKLHDPEAAFWMGPNQWMVGAPFATHDDLEAQLQRRFADTASIAEQTDAWVCFDLRGDGIESVMELLCAIDFPKMQIGDATRTVIHHLGCFVICRDPNDWVRIIGPRASAGSLHHAILTAMKSAL